MGRPTKLSPEVTERILEGLRAGAYAETAAAAAGIGRSTLYRWLQLGEDPDAPAEFREFRDAIKRAEAEAEAEALEVILAASRKSWQAAAWYLERRHPDRWRNRTATYSPTSPTPGDRDPVEAMHDELRRLRELREQKEGADA